MSDSLYFSLSFVSVCWREERLCCRDNKQGMSSEEFMGKESDKDDLASRATFECELGSQSPWTFFLVRLIV